MSDTVVRFMRTDLGDLTKIGSGGQGTVFDAPRLRVNHTASAVYKEYHRPVLEGMDLDQLEAMVRFAGSLPASDQAQLFKLCAWPLALVTDAAGTVAGIAMPRVPPEFFVTLRLSAGPKQTLAQFQHLLNTEEWLGRRGLAISDRSRLQLVAAAARGLEFLHERGITVGDLSAKNLLFSLGSTPSCYFIDCDAMALDSRSVMQQLETPDWDIRSVSEEPLATARSDTYKLALATLRLFAMDQTTRSVRYAGVMAAPVREIITGALQADPTRRPALSTWLPALEGATGWASTKLPSTIYDWRAPAAPKSATDPPLQLPPPVVTTSSPYSWQSQQPTPASTPAPGPTQAAPWSALTTTPGTVSGQGGVVDQLKSAALWLAGSLTGLALPLSFVAADSFEQRGSYPPYWRGFVHLLMLSAPTYVALIAAGVVADLRRRSQGRQPNSGEIQLWQWGVFFVTAFLAMTAMYAFAKLGVFGLSEQATTYGRYGISPASWIAVYGATAVAYITTVAVRAGEP